MYIYQFDSKGTLVSVYPSLLEAERITGIADSTISSAIFKKGLCRGKWYFSKKRDFKPEPRLKNPVAGQKFTVTVTDDVWDRLLIAIGHRKKQDIFRNLLLAWLIKEECRNDREDNKAA